MKIWRRVTVKPFTKALFAATLISLVVGFLLVPLLKRTSFYLVSLYESPTQNRVLDALKKEEANVLHKTEILAKDSELKDAIRSGDFQQTISILSEQREKTGLSLITALDNNGVAIARISTVSAHGDNMFQTTSYGRALSRGVTSSTWEIPAIKPNRLILVSGIPVKDGNSTIGALLGGNIIDNSYLLNFKNKYGFTGQDFISYNRNYGMYGYTIPDDFVKLASTMLNSGSDVINNGRTGDIIEISGDLYKMNNIVLSGFEGRTGGILMFDYISRLVVGVIFISIAILIVLAIFILVWLLFRRPHLRSKTLVVVAMAVAVIPIVIYMKSIFEESVVHVVEPKIPIYNSVLMMNPESSVYDMRSLQKIGISLEAGGETINAAEVKIRYQPQKIEVKSIDLVNSICDPSMILEKKIDKDAGLVTIACLTNPTGFSGSDGQIAILDVVPLKPGYIDFDFDNDTAILAKDGLGTNVLRKTVDSRYYIVDYNSKIFQPSIYSTTHPNGERFYDSPNVVINWQKYPNQKYSYLFNSSTDDAGIYMPATESQFTAPITRDGIYYFHLKVSNDKYSETFLFQVKADLSVPVIKEFKVSQETCKMCESIRLNFSAEDSVSGLQRSMYLKIDNGTFYPVVSPMTLSLLEKGTHILTLRVFDNADNYIDKSIVIKAE